MAQGRQIAHHGEAIVLRTWPFLEADLLVSLFTRDGGKVKGVARHAMKSRKRFGGALEPATYVRAHYTEKPKQDLVRLDSFEIVWSPMSAPMDTLRLAATQLIVEALDEALPDGAVEDNVFRLAIACLTAMAATAGNGGEASDPVWVSVTYFCVWLAKLMGWWPELGHCTACGLDLRGSEVWWSPVADGVTCSDDRRPQSRRLTAASVLESYQIARSPLETLLEAHWPQHRAADLRAFAVGVLERHLEHRLRSAAWLVTGV
jgi:DNA repair protein RecO (recombination protein O)